MLENDHRIIGVEITEAKMHADHVILTVGVSALALLSEKGIDLPLSSSPSILLKLITDAEHAFLPCIAAPEMKLRYFVQNEIICS